MSGYGTLRVRRLSFKGVRNFEVIKFMSEYLFFVIIGRGVRLFAEYLNFEIKLGTEFDVDLHTVLVCKGTAVLCFSGKGNDTPQVKKRESKLCP